MFNVTTLGTISHEPNNNNKDIQMIPKTQVQVIGQRKRKNWKTIRMGESGERQLTVEEEGPWLQGE